MEPFLRWAGGKTWLKKEIKNYLPNDYSNYFEPFLGGGSFFFYTSPNGVSYLSDLNKELISTYSQVKEDVEKVISYLKEFKNTERDYYIIRGMKFKDPFQRASQFIFLNMTSFNGIYRVNRKGEYNVPYGHRATIDFVQEENLRMVSQKLQNAQLNDMDFERAISQVRPNDLVFLDPPYTVAHSNNGFIGYNQKLFSVSDQHRLANLLRDLDKIGAKYILTNAYHKKIREIYKDTGNFSILSRMSLIGGKNAKRQLIKEYMIRNFK